MSSRPAPERLWEHTLHSIDITLEHPHGAHFMPKAPVPSSGIIAFPPSLDSKWLQHLASIPNKALLKEEKRAEYLYFLQNPKAPPIAANGYRETQRKSFKHVALRDYELGEGTPHIYRKSTTKNGKTIPSRYAACENDAFRIIANVHSQLHHQGITKTMAEVGKRYHGITERNVKWVIDACVVCVLDRRNKTKPITTPIISEGCLDRVQIDLMDFRAKADGDNKWILQVKDHFSCFVWLYPLTEKTAMAVARCMETWFMYNGYPLILQCDNGNEFKGELIELCQNVGVKIVNGPVYRPQTQGSVESANKTFKKRLTAMQTEFGTDEWVRYLMPISIALNTTRHASLQAGVSPFEVHFGRPPRWTFRGPAALRPGGFDMAEEPGEGEPGGHEGAEGDVVVEDGDGVVVAEEDEDENAEIGAGEGGNNQEEEHEPEPELESEDEDASEEDSADDGGSTDGYESAVGSQFTAMEQQVLRHKDRSRQLLLEKQVRQNATVFSLTEIATLRIPRKMLGQGEAKRLPVRIHSKPFENGYVLISKWGRLRGTFLHEDLNKESEETQKELGEGIPFGHLDIDDGHVSLINLTRAVQEYKNRGTVAAGQKNGRKRARTANPVQPRRVRAWKPRTHRPRLTSEDIINTPASELIPLDPRLSDEAQAAEAAQLEAARLAAVTVSRKPGWEMQVVIESSEPEFEEPTVLTSRTRSQKQAQTEPL